MNANIIPSLRPKPFSFFLHHKPFAIKKTQLFSHGSTGGTTLLRRPHSPTAAAASPTTTNNSTSEEAGNGDETTAGAVTTPPPRAPATALGIRYQSRSQRKRARQLEERESGSYVAPKPPPKDWEEMTLAEKAVELYVGEKGLLFWLNKFAYASIFIIIGAWILFRFVGPSLGLYQLDAPPLPPTAVFKGGDGGSS